MWQGFLSGESFQQVAIPVLLGWPFPPIFSTLPCRNHPWRSLTEVQIRGGPHTWRQRRLWEWFWSLTSSFEPFRIEGMIVYAIRNYAVLSWSRTQKNTFHSRLSHFFKKLRICLNALQKENSFVFGRLSKWTWHKFFSSTNPQ